MSDRIIGPALSLMTLAPSGVIPLADLATQCHHYTLPVVSTLPGEYAIGGADAVARKMIRYVITEADHSAEHINLPPYGFPDANVQISAPLTRASAVGRIDAPGPTSPFLNDNITKVCDFNAIVHRLAHCLAWYASRGTCSWGALRTYAGDVPGRLQTIDPSMTGNLSIPGNVYLHAFTTRGTGSNAFFAVLAAALSTGATVLTDLLPASAPGVFTFPAATPSTVAGAVSDALGMLGARYASMGATSLFAWIVASGFAQVFSVAGHTDEGAILRPLLTSTHYDQPMGALIIDEGQPLLPTWPDSIISLSSARGWVHAVLLLTAANYAVADPTLSDGPTRIPTILKVGACVDSDAGRRNYAARFKACISQSFPAFSANYSRATALAWGGRIDDMTLSSVLQQALNAITSVPSRHALSVVAPYYWIDPEWITRYDTGGFAANFLYNGLPGVSRSKTTPLFEKSELLDSSGCENYVIAVVGSARTCGLIKWLSSHPLDGLALVHLYRADTEMFVNSRYDPTAMRQAILANRPLSNHLWRRGHCPYPAPHEFVNLAGTLGLSYSEFTDRGLIVSHLPAAATITHASFNEDAGSRLLYSRGPIGFVGRSWHVASRALVNYMVLGARLKIDPSRVSIAARFTAPVLQASSRDTLPFEEVHHKPPLTGSAIAAPEVPQTVVYEMRSGNDGHAVAPAGIAIQPGTVQHTRLLPPGHPVAVAPAAAPPPGGGGGGGI